jgi:diguanylate cyclase (GGDEF)-like protein/PAS domain S-box-containing protein
MAGRVTEVRIDTLRTAAVRVDETMRRLQSSQREIERRRRQQTALAELGQAALTGVDDALLVGQTCALIESVIESSYCSIVQHDAAKWVLRFGVGANATFADCTDAASPHHNLLFYTLLVNEPVVFSNVAADPRVNGDHLLGVHHVDAGISLPIPGRDDPYGVLTVYSERQRTFTTDEIEFLRAVADLTGAMIASARIDDARRRAEQARVETEDRFRALVENAAEGIALLDANGNFLYSSPSTERVLGYGENALLGRNFAELVHPSDLEHARKKLRELLAEPGREERGELRLLHAGNAWIWIDGTYTNLLHNPAVRAIVVNYRDVTERKIAEEQLQHLAYRDSLTDLPNRFLFHDRLQHAMDYARRRGRGLAVMYLDLDRFKVVNDTLGHTIGDELLQVVARRLRDALRTDDTIARLGGDELGVILNDMERAEDAGHVAHKLLQTLRDPVSAGGHELHVTASIGIALFPSDGDDVETLIKHADAALYRAKDLGRDRAQLFASSMNARYRQRLELELDLHRALTRNEFTLHFQPLCDRATRTIRGFEALIRWQRPQHGVVPPADFIHVAEETRLIVPLGEWALDAACHQLRQWRDAGLPHFRVAVNLSAHEIAHPGFIHVVHDVLTRYELAPEDLELEITESAALQNLEWTLSVLDQLRTLGVRIAIDDFGTGQSSLVYLKRLPVHTLKIDREFLRDVRSEASDAAILESIIHLGHSLGLYVVAEGVELEDDRALLEQQECDGFQGYLFGKPMEASRVGEFLAQFRYPDVA